MDGKTYALALVIIVIIWILMWWALDGAYQLGMFIRPG